MDQARQQQIITALNTKGVRLPCPRCGSLGFAVVGESVVSIQEDPTAFVVGGPVVPAVIIVCQHCGYLTQHAQAPLGLLNKQEGNAGT